jgi:hypothetical protein
MLQKHKKLIGDYCERTADKSRYLRNMGDRLLAAGYQCSDPLRINNIRRLWTYLLSIQI